jgi:hypothetical protein
MFGKTYFVFWICLTYVEHILIGGVCAKMEKSGERRIARWLRQIPGPWTGNVQLIIVSFYCRELELLLIRSELQCGESSRPSIVIQVYDGTRPWWKEDDETRPVNAYGQSKLDAEKLIQVKL